MSTTLMERARSSSKMSLSTGLSPIDLGSMVGQDSWEEKFGDYDPAAAPDSPRSTGSSAIDDRSGVLFGGNVED